MPNFSGKFLGKMNIGTCKVTIANAYLIETCLKFYETKANSTQLS
jgi:hypothetical protein